MLIIWSILIKLGTSGSNAQAGCYYDGNEFCLHREDILSVDLLPGSFLLTDPTTEGENRLEELNNATVDGSVDRAIDEMDFHRKRMNEYLCHGFMAEEIFREMKSIRVKRRPDDRSSLVNSLTDFLGDPGLENDDDYTNDVGTAAGFENLTVQHKLLSDEGSTKYKDWLQRTTTLDDVYRHYAPRKKLRKKNGLRYSTNSPAFLPNAGTIDEFDGEVTGYAMPAPVTSDKTGSYYYDSPDDHMIPSSSGHSYHPHHPPDLTPIIHEEHYYSSPSHGDYEEYWPKSYGKGKGHGLSVKDFFEIALTALAFLSFGLFIIQLLMNITNANMTTMPAVVTDVDGARFKRGSGSSTSGNEELNELSHRVLRSIEAAMVAERDSGKCLRWSLCTDNRYSRGTSGPRKIWLPMWSLGMSWVSGRVLKKRAWPAMLESVKASILGLGGADCSSVYPGCDLPRERIKRRRRRRK